MVVVGLPRPSSVTASVGCLGGGAAMAGDDGYREDVEEKKEQYAHYNILPLYAVGVKPAIMELPEIKAALRNVDNLPLLRKPGDRDKSVNDILEWLSLIFGFQKGNVANQREHLILLLANIDTRSKNVEDYDQNLVTG